MSKQFLSISLALLLIGALAYFYLTQNLKPTWGHHFTFENELGINIDSLEISIGDVKTTVYPHDDNSLARNLDVPRKGYPHQVVIEIYNGATQTNMNAEPFNCYNCDGTHAYILKTKGAEYKFHN